ncbi:MAG: 16S rRNA (uracil(1498)-N(3))-methyltransferase [Lachnospiraceae bacterium]|nr:16S rRNA (uracil(1498)-N(3))-methyltransferase [Robinsoniella sp.]MDY3766167.1 16S rRNA (uracil(1498)-N(3))-methyltransferase [Lachnospiraceae bacterium]
MYHFFVDPDQIGEKEIQITGKDVNHIKNVLRMQPGEEICINSGQDNREYRCEIASLSEEEICAKIMWVEEVGMELPNKIYLFQGLPKSDKMEWIIQKAVELGVYEIVPVATKRAVVKLDVKKEQNKRKRWQGISESAAKQSKRTMIPQIHPVLTFEQAVEYARNLDVKLIPYELAEGMKKTRELFTGIGPGQSVAVFIGPEGGFDEQEVAFAMQCGVIPVTLGKRILRTETAGMAVLSMLVFCLEPEE